MRGVALGVALVVTGLYFVGLGGAPFVDPPEGFHAGVAQSMRATGDVVAPRANGVRYFDKPPLLYWLMAGSFAVAGPTPLAARFWSALAAVGVAAGTARLNGLIVSADAATGKATAIERLNMTAADVDALAPAAAPR